MIRRREFIGAAAFAGGASTFHQTMAEADEPQPLTEIIDTNVNLFQWPFRSLPLDTTQVLVDKLRSLGVTQAWAGSFEGLLHRDITSVNERLVKECREHEELVPIGSINPELPGWEQDLKRCSAKHSMPGIRIHPNYHGYTLADPRCIRLIQQSTLAGQFVQIAAKMEDTRTQHSLLQVPDVDLTSLPSVIEKCPGARIQILNDRPRGQLLEQLTKVDGVFFDTSRVDGTDGISKLIETVSSERVLFGSHAPFLIPEAALIRVHESDLTAQQLHSLMLSNSQTFNQSSKADRS